MLPPLAVKVVDKPAQTAAPVPPVMAGHIALILREALSNVARHARATQVDVLVMVENHRVVMEVTDDGIGFTTAVATEGNGLANMRTRASAMDGTFTVDRLADGGTKLVWQAPLTGIGAG